jgi:uncharacterized protein (TIGR02217 family)
MITLDEGGFHEVQFPPDISYGSSGGPGFNTNIITVDSGAESRIVRWSAGRCQYDAAKGVQSQADLHELITFYRARQGAAYGFRYKDWSDFTTAANGTDFNGDVTAYNDCEIGVGNGATTQFQLYKQYSSGPVTRTRKITKPVTGTVKIGVNGSELVSGWSVNTTTGIVTFDTAPANGHSITAGFAFDVPVRFAEDADRQMSVRLEDYDNGSAQVPLVEVLDSGLSADEFFFGGGQEIETAANYTISGITRVWVFNVTASSKTVNLPSPAALPPGGPWFLVYNDGALSFTLAGTGLSLVLAAGQMAVCNISVDGSGTNYWYTG